jgi:hypothetical protein
LPACGGISTAAKPRSCGVRPAVGRGLLPIGLCAHLARFEDDCNDRSSKTPMCLPNESERKYPPSPRQKPNGGSRGLQAPESSPATRPALAAGPQPNPAIAKREPSSDRPLPKADSRSLAAIRITSGLATIRQKTNRIVRTPTHPWYQLFELVQSRLTTNEPSGR